MVTVAQGRDEVLAYLENESEKTAEKPGVYLLLKDDSGTLIAIIAGRSFIGTGFYSLGGNRMLVEDGRVVHLQKQKNG